MDWTANAHWGVILFGGIAVVGLLALLAALGLWLGTRRLVTAKALQQLGNEAGYFETLRHVPLLLVLCLDVLDLTLDVFSAPVVWMLLGRFELRALRRVAAVKALIPGTQLLPLLTLCWILARLGFGR